MNSRHIRMTMAAVLLATFIVVGIVGASELSGTPEPKNSRWQNASRAELQTAAEAGNAQAQYVFGVREWAEASADVGRAIRQWSLKWTRERPAPSDAEQEAMRAKWAAVPEPEAIKAALSGDWGARLFLNKRDTERALERARSAFEWLKKAAAQSLPAAEAEVASRYLGRSGWRVVPVDTQEGMKWLRKAVTDGAELAQHLLADMLIQGDGLPVDLAEGIEYLRKAADQGCPRAQFELAQQYAGGNGEPRNSDDTALALLTSAAKAGLVDAQFCLGERYRLGLAVQPDRAKAFFWHDLAAAQTPNAATQRDKLKAGITPEDERQFELWRKELKLLPTSP